MDTEYDNFLEKLATLTHKQQIQLSTQEALWYGVEFADKQSLNELKEEVEDE